MQSSKDAFLTLVRLGIGRQTDASPSAIDWEIIQILAEQQGLSGIVLDGLDKVPNSQRPEKKDLLQLIGSVLQLEEQYAIQWKSACEMALLFANNAMRTYVLKGHVISECYPNPIHRNSADMDCFLIPEQGDFDAWDLGNQLIKNEGFEVDEDYYKNSAFFLPGLTVENHHFMVPFRGNKTLKKLEKVLQVILRADKGEDRIEGTDLYRPPILMTALFLIEHAYSHFLHEGMTWRHVLDWMMFSEKHRKDINWNTLDAFIDELGFRRFYDAYCHLGQLLLGNEEKDSLSKAENKMLDDIWAPLDLHETLHGVKGKLGLVGNTWRARWKYRYFSEISWIKALWIQIFGYLFEKNPKLN